MKTEAFENGLASGAFYKPSIFSVVSCGGGGGGGGLVS